jgi:nicotinate-nucleotide adenylyltransferase
VCGDAVDMTARIGLFGGSFNPVHFGHLLMAKAALEELSLSRLHFIPAAQSPFKLDNTLAPAAERVRLLRLALAGQSRCAIDEQEIMRGGVSYSIETVRAYANRFPGAELWYLIGGDHAQLLPRWRQAEELARLVQFAVIPRPGEQANALPEPFRGTSLRGWALDVSASKVRERVRVGLPIDCLVPPAVAEAIQNYRLYL